MTRYKPMRDSSDVTQKCHLDRSGTAVSFRVVERPAVLLRLQCTGMREKTFYVYIMASRSRTLYIGFTSAIEGRVWKHKNDVYDGFSRQYQCHRLVHMERYATPEVAIAREKQLKRWSRGKKITLILRENPAWADLSENWGKPLECLVSEPAALSAAQDGEAVLLPPTRQRTVVLGPGAAVEITLL